MSEAVNELQEAYEGLKQAEALYSYLRDRGYSAALMVQSSDALAFSVRKWVEVSDRVAGAALRSVATS